MSRIKSQGLRYFLAPALLNLGVALLAMACGDDRDGSTANGGSDSAPVTFDISLNDRQSETALVSFFSPDEFTVSAGQEVTFDLTNDGTVPHNTRIAGPDGEYMTDDDAVSNPDILKPGDTAVLKWTAPSESGSIIFRCDFHPDSVGTINVQ